MKPSEIIPLRVRVDLEVMAMKEYVQLPRFPELVSWLVVFYGISTLLVS